MRRRFDSGSSWARSGVILLNWLWIVSEVEDVADVLRRLARHVHIVGG